MLACSVDDTCSLTDDVCSEGRLEEGSAIISDDLDRAFELTKELEDIQSQLPLASHLFPMF